jgi:hypothetical protein
MIKGVKYKTIKNHKHYFQTQKEFHQQAIILWANEKQFAFDDGFIVPADEISDWEVYDITRAT